MTYTIIAVSVAVVLAGALLVVGRWRPSWPSRKTVDGEVLVLAWAAVAAGVALSPAPALIRVAFGAPLALFLPGLALAGALFASTIPWIERIAASIGLSLAVCVVGGFALHWTPTGLTAPSWVGVLLGTTMIGAALAKRRPGGGRLVTSSPGSWLATHGRLLVAVPVAVIVVAVAVVLVRTPLPAKGVSGYTALWLAPAGNQRDAVRIGVESAEFQMTPYRLELRVAGEIALTRRLTLRTGDKWSAVIEARSIVKERRSFEARLYRGNESQSVYRRATLALPGATLPPSTAIWLNQVRPARNTVRVVVASAEPRPTSFRVELFAGGERARTLRLTLSTSQRQAIVVDLSETAAPNRAVEALLYREGDDASRPPYREAKLILDE